MTIPPPPQSRWARLEQAAKARGIPLPTILTVVAVVVIVYLLGKLAFALRDVLLIIVLSGFVATFLNPVVANLQRWVPRRGYAVLLVTVCAAVVFAGLAAGFGYPLINGLTHFARNLPLNVSRAEQGKGLIGHLVRKYHVEAWVTANSAKLETAAQDLGRPALTVGKAASSLLATLGVVFFLVLLFLLEGPKITRAVVGLMSPDRAARYTRLAGEISRSVSGFMLGDLITSAIAGAVVYVTLLILGVPFPLVWGLWVALVDFLPQIGGALAGIPTVLFALSHSLSAGIVTAVVFVVYTQIENHVLNPVVMSRTVKVSPLLVLLAALVAVNIGNIVDGVFGAFVGALLATPAAGTLQIICRDLWQLTATPAVAPASAPPPETETSADVSPD